MVAVSNTYENPWDFDGSPTTESIVEKINILLQYETEYPQPDTKKIRVEVNGFQNSKQFETSEVIEADSEEELHSLLAKFTNKYVKISVSRFNQYYGGSVQCRDLEKVMNDEHTRMNFFEIISSIKEKSAPNHANKEKEEKTFGRH